MEDFRHFFRSDRQLRLLQDALQLGLVPRHTDADRNGEIIEDTDDLDPVVEMLGGQIATGIIAADRSLALSGIDALHRGEKGRIDLELDLRVIAPNGVVEEIANRRGQSLAVEIREAMDTLQPFAPAAPAGAHQHRGATQVGSQDLEAGIETLRRGHGRRNQRFARIQSTFRLDEVSGSAEGKLQAAALADQVQIVTPDTAQPPLAIQLPERAKGMVDHHRHDRMRGEPTLFRRRKRHPGLVETQAPPGAPTAQQFVAVAPIDTRQGSIEDREQRLIPRPEQETETLAVDGREVLDTQVQQVMGLDEIVRGDGVTQHAIDVPHAQRFQGKLRRVEPDDLAVRIGGLDTFGGKITLDRGQPGLRLRIERGAAGRHQYRPVGKIRSGCQQSVLPGLDLATDTEQIDLSPRQRSDCRLPRRKVPDTQRPLEHQGQVIGREALVGTCVEDG